MLVAGDSVAGYLMSELELDGVDDAVQLVIVLLETVKLLLLTLVLTINRLVPLLKE
jgi:hypothetical protein